MVSEPKDKELEIIIGEDEDIISVVVQVDEEDLSTTVYSDYSAEENIDILLEAVGANAQELIEQGRDRQDVIEELRDTLEQIIDGYLDDTED